MNTKVILMGVRIISNTLWSIRRRFKNTLEGKIAGDFSNLSITVAVFWFLIRVLPKPSRITYPCQRATLSLLLAKVVIVLASATSIVTDLFKRKSVKIVCFCVLVGTIVAEPAGLIYYQTRYSILGLGNKNLTLADVSVSFPTNRVVRVHSDDASSWDFSTGYYWEYVDQSVVDQMVEEGVKALTGASDAQTAWQTIMSSYVSGDRVGIKINGNDWWNNDQREIDSLPQLVNSVIKGLKSIGVPESNIYIIENTYPSITWRVIPSYYTAIIRARYPNVVFQYDSRVSPTYGTVAGTEVNFPYTSTRRINDQIASCDHLILMPIMKAITPSWGITGSIKLMQGVIENVGDFHGWLARETADNPNVLMYQNQHIIGKTRIIIGDGIFGAWTGQHFGEGGWGWMDYGVETNDIPKPWITFNNDAPNCLFFSIDPVAIDSVMLDHLNAERARQDDIPGQSTPQLPEPQLIAGAAAGLGIREHGPPYSNIDYVEIELGEAPPITYGLTITSTVGGTTDPVPGTYTYPEGTIATVTAIPDTEYLFDHWELDGVVRMENPTDITMDMDHTLRAVFVTTHAFSVSSSPITGIPFTVDGFSHSTPWSGSLTEGSHTIVMPSSVTDAGVTYNFKDWEDSSTNPTRTIHLVEEMSITAYYEKITTPPPEPSPSPPLPSPANGTLEVHAYCDSIEINSTVEVVGVGAYTTPFTLELEVETYTLHATYDEQTQTKTAKVTEGAVIQVEFYFADTVKPTAHAGPDQPVNEDTPMRFDGSASSDNIGIVSYTWTFMDVTPQRLTGVNPTYTFATPGVYTVTLTVRDAAGNYATDTTLVTVLDVTAPIADAGDDQTVTEGTPVNFSADGSSDNVDLVSYEWDFGDGTRETGETITHTYTDPGNYTVTLTVKDAAANSGTGSISITVLSDTDKDGTPDIMDIDDDGDGMPDVWEIANGLNPLDATDASLNPDNDNLTNLEEHQKGTDPNVSGAAAPPGWISGAVVPLGIATLAVLAVITALYITKVRKT